MDTLEKIKKIQKEIKECDDDTKALSLQAQLMKLLEETLQNKDYLKNIFLKKDQK